MLRDWFIGTKRYTNDDEGYLSYYQDYLLGEWSASQKLSSRQFSHSRWLNILGLSGFNLSYLCFIRNPNWCVMTEFVILRPNVSLILLVHCGLHLKCVCFWFVPSMLSCVMTESMIHSYTKQKPRSVYFGVISILKSDFLNNKALFNRWKDEGVEKNEDVKMLSTGGSIFPSSETHNNLLTTRNPGTSAPAPTPSPSITCPASLVA